MPVDPEHGWLPPGITGLSRQREWDAVTTVAAPGMPGDEVIFVALADGRLIDEVGTAVLEPLAQALGGSLAPPFRASAVRHDDVWAVGGYAIDVVQLDPDPEGDDLELTWDGETLVARRGRDPGRRRARRVARAGRVRAPGRAVRGAGDTARGRPLRALDLAALARAALPVPSLRWRKTSARSRRSCASARAGGSSGSPSRRPTSARSSPISRRSRTTSCAARPPSSSSASRTARRSRRSSSRRTPPCAKPSSGRSACASSTSS